MEVSADTFETTFSGLMAKCKDYLEQEENADPHECNTHLKLHQVSTTFLKIFYYICQSFKCFISHTFDATSLYQSFDST